MAGPYYLDDLMVDGFLIEKLATKMNCSDPLFNDPLKNITDRLVEFVKDEIELLKPVLKKISEALQPYYDFLLTNNTIGEAASFMKEWAPILVPIFLAGLQLCGIPVPNWAITLSVAEAVSLLIIKLRSKAQDSLFSIVWRFLKRVVGQLNWSLLWNPWFIAGTIAVATVVWLMVKWFAENS